MLFHSGFGLKNRIHVSANHQRAKAQSQQLRLHVSLFWKGTGDWEMVAQDDDLTTEALFDRFQCKGSRPALTLTLPVVELKVETSGGSDDRCAHG